MKTISSHSEGKDDAASSTHFAFVTVMTWLKSSARKFSEFVTRMFGRLAAVIIGLCMAVLGLAMTATIVMLPVGVVIGVLGVAVVVAGIFAPIDPTLPSDQR